MEMYQVRGIICALTKTLMPAHADLCSAKYSRRQLEYRPDLSRPVKQKSSFYLAADLHTRHAVKRLLIPLTRLATVTPQPVLSYW